MKRFFVLDGVLKKVGIVGVVLVIAGGMPTASAKKVDWQEITPEDQSFVSPDGAPAVVLFEKVVVDDRDLERSNVFTDYYRRIKICHADGVRWGDIVLDYLDGDDIKDIHARTILPSGEVLELNERSIQEGTVLKAEDIRVKRKAFSMPGCAAGSIIEYKYRLRRSEPSATWQFQSELPMQLGELRWKWCKHWRHTSDALVLQILGGNPSYIWINGALPGRVLPLPEETFFEVRDVPALYLEPFAMPLESLQGGLRCYYGEGRGSQEFWVRCAGILNLLQDTYVGENKAVNRLTTERGWRQSGTAPDSAFHWIQKSLTISPARRASDIGKIRLSVDDVMKSGSGNQFDAALTLIAFLRAMNLDAQMVYAKDGRTGMVNPKLEDWQFNEFLVRVGHISGSARYFAPGHVAIEAGRIPWYLEGTEALILGDELFKFEALPQSPPESNGMQSVIHIAVSEAARGQGTTEVTFFGHRARELRLRLENEGEVNRMAILSEVLREDVVDAKIESLEVEGLAERCGPLSVRAKIIVEKTPGSVEDGLPVNPFLLRLTPKNQFKAENRIYPVSLGYSYSMTDVIELEIPSDWKGNVLGSDVSFKNALGAVKTESQLTEGRVTSRRMFRLASGFWPETLYKEGRELFSALEETQALTHMVGP